MKDEEDNITQAIILRGSYKAIGELLEYIHSRDDITIAYRETSSKLLYITDIRPKHLHPEEVGDYDSE